ncbi:MAG: DUF1566 domain-containing protein [Treponema sp.]|jgi:hypothetical protein|nr:DUF1566 domain-containing protein [Treponema sp.]
MMKSKGALLFGLVLAVVFFLSGAPYIPVIVVFPFESKGGIAQDDADRVRALCIKELMRIDNVRVYDAVQWRHADLNFYGTVEKPGGQFKINLKIENPARRNEPLAIVSIPMKSLAEACDKMRQQIPLLVQKLADKNYGMYTIGEDGPGGGVVFSIDRNNAKYKECLMLSGEYTWNKAQDAAQGYDGGGYQDWRLPTKAELDQIYKNVWVYDSPVPGSRLGIFWSSEEFNTNEAWGLACTTNKAAIILKATPYISMYVVRDF